jgi:hypothetical protein
VGLAAAEAIVGKKKETSWEFQTMMHSENFIVYLNTNYNCAFFIIIIKNLKL